MSTIAEMMKSTIRAHVLAARRELGAEATARDVAELALQRRDEALKDLNNRPMMLEEEIEAAKIVSGRLGPGMVTPTNVARVACGCPKCMSELTEDVATKVAAAPKPEAVH
jgi:hypothetical protein